MNDTSKQDHFLMNHVDDLIGRARDQYYITRTDFLDMHEQTVVLRHLQNTGIVYRLYGGYELAERKQVMFMPEADYQIDDTTIHYVKVTLPKIGIKRQPNHRDFLGALMNLGIERKLIGDLLVQDGYAIIICTDAISSFICENLIQIGSTSVKCMLVTDESQWQDYTPNYSRIKCTVASNRLDSIIKVGTHMTRTNSLQYIKAGKVFLNGKETKTPSAAVAEGSIISVRGKGKFKLATIGNITKKGRIFMEIDLYR